MSEKTESVPRGCLLVRKGKTWIVNGGLRRWRVLDPEHRKEAARLVKELEYYDRAFSDGLPRKAGWQDRVARARAPIATRLEQIAEPIAN